MSYLVYLGLGANLDQPQQQLGWAVKQLAELPQCQLVAVSRLYRSKPAIGSPENQPDYTNAVVSIVTTLTPHHLLQQLQAIENQAGRVRVERWGARILDLDILLYAQDEIKTTDLTIPHLELCHRSFVVLPLLDICPILTLPNGTKIASLATATGSDDIHVTADNTWWQSPSQPPPLKSKGNERLTFNEVNNGCFLNHTTRLQKTWRKIRDDYLL